MRMVIVVMRDDAAQAFGQPVFVPNVSLAIRSFKDAAKGKDTAIAEHPEDFSLFKLGEYDDQDGSFHVHAPERLLRAIDAKAL